MGKIPQPTRAEHVKLLIPLFEQNKDELAQLYVKEQGKTLAEAQGEIDKSIQFIDYMTSLSMSNKGEVLQNSVEMKQSNSLKTYWCHSWHCALECTYFSITT